MDKDTAATRRARWRAQERLLRLWGDLAVPCLLTYLPVLCSSAKDELSTFSLRSRAAVLAYALYLC
jgi:hypothetical protein